MSRLRIAPPTAPEPEDVPPAPQSLEPAPSPPAAVPAVPKGVGRLPVAAPAPKDAPTNLHLPSDGYVDLNFKVEAELRQRFKMEAVRRGMSNKDFLAACFKVYLETFPSSEGIIELREPTTEQRSRRIALRKERKARMEKIRNR